MNLQISIFGLLIVAVFYVVAAIGLMSFWRWCKGRLGKACVATLALVVLVLPWADEGWIAWHFAQACKEAGVKIHRKVAVEGYLNASSSALPSSLVRVGPIGKPGELADFEKAGYRFAETLLKDGRIWHLEREGEQLVASVLDRPAARYHYKRIIDFRDKRGIHHEEPVAFKVEKTGWMVVDSTTGLTLGEKIMYKRYPGWVEGLWIGFFGSGMTMCPDPEIAVPQPSFPASVLIPAKSK